MRTAVKGAVIFLIFMVATPIFALAKQSPGLHVPVIAGVTAAVYGVWKYDPDSNDEDEEYALDKS